MPVSKEAWTLIAEGDLGDQIIWKKRFKAIEEVVNILGGLDQIGEKKNVDWSALLDGFSDFAGVLQVDFPPFYNVMDLESAFSDFLCIKGEPLEQGGVYPAEFPTVEVYVDRDTEAEVLNLFKAFLKHLKKVPQLREAGLV